MDYTQLPLLSQATRASISGGSRQLQMSVRRFGSVVYLKPRLEPNKHVVPLSNHPSFGDLHRHYINGYNALIRCRASKRRHYTKVGRTLLR